MVVEFKASEGYKLKIKEATINDVNKALEKLLRSVAEDPSFPDVTLPWDPLDAFLVVIFTNKIKFLF